MQNNNEKRIVVIDIGNPALDGNKVFVPEDVVKVSHTILPICYLHDRLVEFGYEVVTPDVYLAMEKTDTKAVLISYLTNRRTDQIIKAGAKPLILNCLESPFIATKFYILLRLISRKFKYSVLFEGMKKMASPKTKFISARFPESFDGRNFSSKAFQDRLFIAMISSNKSVGSFVKNFIIGLLYGSDVKEIYQERLRAINFLAPKQILDLFGFGWDNAVGDQKTLKNINGCYRGKVTSKIETLRGYKYTLCFENTVFKGYVTEKIFDAMFAGSVPIYLGAPDIAKYVPAGAFINIKDFADWNALYDYLINISENQYNNYLEEIRLYLQSEKFKEFTQEKFAEKIISLVSQEL